MPGGRGRRVGQVFNLSASGGANRLPTCFTLFADVTLFRNRATLSKSLISKKFEGGEKVIVDPITPAKRAGGNLPP